MKESMKKMTLLTFYKDKKQIIDQLQELGVVHIDSKVEEASGELLALKKQKEEWERSLQIIKEFDSGESSNGQLSDIENQNPKDQIFNLDHQREEIRNKLEWLEKESQQLSPWGEFDWSRIELLENKGVFIRFFSATKKEFNKFEFKDCLPQVIGREGSRLYFVVVGRKKKNEELPFERINLLRESLNDIGRKKEQLSIELMNVENQLGSMRRFVPKINRQIDTISDQLANFQALESFENKAKGKIAVIRGWFPEEKENQILKLINENELSFRFENPKPADAVPIILKNRKYPKIFEKITEIFQLPNYYEFDLTPFIAVFYPIFFAYCLGDAGYGLILILISSIGAFTFLKTMKGVSLLGLVLGAFTMVMGIVKSGTVFGIPILQNQEITFFRFLGNYVVVTDDQDYLFNAFNVALMIGVVQILLAICISIVRKIKYKGWVQSLSTFGKLFIIAGILILFLGGIQKMEFFIPLMVFGKVSLVLGIILVLGFHDMTTSLARRIGSGVLPIYFIVTGLLGDALSYIRLFALGVASSILGLVVNQIGSQILDGAGMAGISLGIIFLIFGHTLNFSLACLGAFVHPLRLTFVEFYNNAEFQGGGVEYHPLKKQVAQEIN